MAQEVNSSFYVSLIEFLMSAKQQIVAIGSEFDLTGIQVITLLLVDGHLPRPMKNLCQLYHCDASNITGIIDGLENKGLVSRRNDVDDRRIKVIRLEHAGKQMQTAIIERFSTIDDTLLAPLTTTERRELTRLVEKIAAGKAPRTTC